MNATGADDGDDDDGDHDDRKQHVEDDVYFFLVPVK